MNTHRLLTLVLFAGALVPGALPAAETVLFAFDDEAFPWRDNAHLTLVAGDKHPDNPVLRCGPEGAPDHGHAIIYGSVLQIEGKLRMWYLGMSQRRIERGNAPGWWRPMCYAESEDGVRWTKPDLGLVEFNGSRKNNICLIESEPHSLSRVNDFLTVIHEPGDPDPRRRYKCAYIAHPPIEDVRGGRSAIGPKESRWAAFVCATSPDGLRWTVVGDRPMNAGGERFEVSGLYRFGNHYYATGQLISPWTWRADGSDIGRVMLAYRSADFLHWSRQKALAFARPGQLTQPPIPGQQTHMGAGLWNRGNVLVGFYGMWQDGPRDKPKGSTHLWGTRIDLGLIVSNDGVRFREPVPDFKMIPRGAEGRDWDSIALLQGHAFANLGDKTCVWYSHWDCEGQFRSQEIGLATWRRDGFGHLSLHEPRAPGSVGTRILETGSGRATLSYNADGLDKDRPLTVELLDERDRPLPGYSGADAALLSREAIRGEILWPRSGSGALPPRTRFTVRASFAAGGTARLHALYLGTED